MKTQKELELYALSQQFLEQHVKGGLQLAQPQNPRNQNHQQYATQTYFAQNTNSNQHAF